MKLDIAYDFDDEPVAPGELNSVMDLCLDAIAMLDERRRVFSERVARRSRAMARQMKLGSASQTLLEMAARVHRVGELYVNAEIEDKCFLDMNTEELAAYCHYPILSALKVTRHDEHPLFDILVSHREYFDGCGFLNQFSGTDIPLSSRILCAATEYEELIWRRGRTQVEQDVIQRFMLKNLAGRYDEDVVEALMVTLVTDGGKH